MALTQKTQQHKIRTLLTDQAKRLKIKVRELHCGSSHIQFIVYLSRKKSFPRFIRSVTGSLALKLSGSNKLRPLAEKFWACRPWTCVINQELPFPEELRQRLVDYLKEILMLEVRTRALVEVALGP